jgi:hypothetical protein
MKPNELLDHLKQRRGNEEEMKKEEMDELLKDAHEEEKAIREERDETKKRRSVMTTDVTTHGNWKPHTKDEDDITFMSVNLNSLAYWSQDCNKAERLKHIFEKYKID